jgi:hypothetical protein
MKLRLHGTLNECAAAATLLRCTPGMTITDESRPYPDRTGELVRVYLTVHLDHDRAATRGGGGGRG